MALLDTTLLVDLMKEVKRRRPGPATAKLEDLERRDEVLRIAIFTIGELYIGVTKGRDSALERRAVENCLQLFEVVPFDESTARVFGTIVGDLERQGNVISDMDALIASVALEQDELLVTRNVKHFQRVAGLRVEGH
ncbi:MAG: type II toxin-antitoxin system VapC family toxin [Planctomycetales bacterium]